MNTKNFEKPRFEFAMAIAAIFILLAGGCTGSDGSNGAPGTPGANGLPYVSDAQELAIQITSVTINSEPVVNFKVTNENGIGVTGLTTSGLRFNIAKLMATSPSQWQNYILITQTADSGPGSGVTAVQATRENNGTLDDHNDGSYTYTFNTDITNVSCPAPCKDVYGNSLDVTYDPTLTHRVGMQTRGDLPEANAVYTFRPSDGATTGITTRDIVKTANCNECHDKLSAHDARIEVKYCVLCHNPGSQDPDSIDPAKNTTPDLQPAVIRSSGAVDFKIMIHKIHRGEMLPSVELGPDLQDGTADDGTGDYAIWGYGSSKHDFADIVFPQDIRNCTKCHDGADHDTPDGDNWKTQPSMEACGSCHDNIKFGVAGPDSGGTDPNGHPGGVVLDNSECITCHAANRIAGSIEDAHTVYTKKGAEKFQYEILEICGTAVDADPVCAPSTVGPVVKFRVSDPTGGTHAFGTAYDVRSAGTDAEFSNSSASLNVLMAWNTLDYTNAGGNGTPPARANSVNALTNATSNGDGTFNIVLPDIPGAALASGSGVVAIEGHPAAPGKSGTFTDAVEATVKAQVAYFAITDSNPEPRREIINITTKCDRCHDVLSVHGNNRSDEAQHCVMCHNPSNTDYNRRPKDANGLLTGGIDGKDEESIDFKRMIHAIHAASSSNYDGTIAHGFREQGIVVYGYGGGIHDFSDVRFPGVLSKCDTCHLPDTYKLMDRSDVGGTNWEFPAQNGVQGSTISSIPLATDAPSVTTALADRTDDLKISPTAAVCSSCHDGLLAEMHMTLNGALFGATQADIENNYETCAVCHGPGKVASVEYVHSQQFGEEIP
ncbi:MAG: OmcA/MtrC family decaheme c-type cytochrome [Gammaproteobacteria bacterium]|jgi:OmcA/MtrC family decaheme c-type cytochrome